MSNETGTSFDFFLSRRGSVAAVAQEVENILADAGTRDYKAPRYTSKEFTSFEADRLLGKSERFIVVLRCEDVPLHGLLTDNVYQDLAGVSHPAEHRRQTSHTSRLMPSPLSAAPTRRQRCARGAMSVSDE